MHVVHLFRNRENACFVLLRLFYQLYEPTEVFQLCPLLSWDAEPAKSTQSYLQHPMVNALPQMPGVFISCYKSELGPAQTEVVWKRVPWPPPLYASKTCIASYASRLGGG